MLFDLPSTGVSLIIINHDASQDFGSEKRADDKHLRPKGRAVDSNLAAVAQNWQN